MAIIMSHQLAAKHIVNIGARAGLTYLLLRNTMSNRLFECGSSLK